MVGTLVTGSLLDQSSDGFEHLAIHQQSVLQTEPSVHTNSSSSPEWSTKILDLHRQLVEIESITNNEYALAIFLEHYLVGQGLTVERQWVPQPLPSHSNSTPDHEPRFNIYAYPINDRGAHVLLTSHIDTVPLFYNYTIHDDGSIWGRGVVDAKACVAAQVMAVLQLMEEDRLGRRQGDIALLFVVGEEEGGDGMRKANDLHLNWDAVIFGEPTESKLVTGHKGNLGLTLRATGRGGHSGYPELGKNANLILTRALVALADMEMPWNEKYGNSTLNIGKMEGGVAGNVIAEHASAEIQIRIANGTAAEMKRLVLDTVKRVDGTLEVEWVSKGYGPVDIDSDVEGFEKTTVNYGTDIPNLKGDHKRYLYGPGSILVAHSDHEALLPSNVIEAVHGYKKIVGAALGMKY